MHVCELNRADTCVFKIVIPTPFYTVSSSSRTKLGYASRVIVTNTRLMDEVD